MIIRFFRIKNFRNIKEAFFEFSENVNIFSGNNAQGKTNLMEALAVCLGKNFRRAKAVDIIPFSAGENVKTSIEMMYTSSNYPGKTNTLLFEIRGSRFHITCNGIDIKEAEKLYGALRYVVFTPDDLYLIKGSPEMRRDYIDFTADMMNRVHHKQTAAYKRSVKQKNNMLSTAAKKPSGEDYALAESWNDSIARLGVNVFCGRLKYFRQLEKYASEIYRELNGNNETLTIKYKSSVFRNEDDYNEEVPNAEKLYKIYYERLNSHIKDEFLLKRTMVGIHKDDISFFINGKNARQYASQGQIRSITLSLKLAEARMYAEKSGDRPIVILDDILSELDQYRRNFIINNINNMQIFITGCNKYDFDKLNGRIWNVSQGIFTIW